MFNLTDIRMYSAIGIVLVLVIGYFVYLMYQDLIFLKNEIKEIKENNREDFLEEDYEEDEEEDYEEEEEEEEEEGDVLDFYVSEEDKNEIENKFQEVSPNKYLETIQEETVEELIQEEQVKPKQKRKPRTKKSQEIQDSTNTINLEE